MRINIFRDYSSRYFFYFKQVVETKLNSPNSSEPLVNKGELMEHTRQPMATRHFMLHGDGFSELHCIYSMRR